MLFNDNELKLLISWMNENTKLLNKIWVDEEIIRIKESTQFFRAKSAEQAKQFLIISQYHSFLTRYGFLG